MSNDSEENDARELFTAFHGSEPEDGDLAFVENTDVIFPLGKLHAVSYILDVDGEEQLFYHEFKHHRPVLCSNSDGTQLYILAGEYEVTEKGIVG